MLSKGPPFPPTDAYEEAEKKIYIIVRRVV